MSDDLTVVFPYSAAEHAEALSEGAAGRNLPRLMRVFGLTMGGLGVLVTVVNAFGSGPLDQVLFDGVSWLCLAALWVWGGPALLKLAISRQLRREAMQESRDEERLTFSEAGFSPSPRWSQPMPWSFVERVIETEQFLLIQHGYSKDPFYIPKHALSEAEKGRLLALLREHLKSNPDQLQLVGGAPLAPAQDASSE